MKVLIDTSSLLSLVRYYLPFDKQKILFDMIKTKIELGEIVVLDKVYEESKFTAQGIVVNTLGYLKDKTNLVKTVDLLPTANFFNQLENQFINGSAKNRLTQVEFEERKNTYLNSADAKLLLYSLKNKNVKEQIIIVSEETVASNDNKSFKKLPAICKILNLEIITLPTLLNIYDEIEFEFR